MKRQLLLLSTCTLLLVMLLTWSAEATAYGRPFIPAESIHSMSGGDPLTLFASSNKFLHAAADSTYLPFISKSEWRTGQNNGWLIECVICPKPFWSMTDRSLRVDRQGQPHIAYGGDQLYYAWFDGTAWHDETVVDYPGVGSYPSLALDSQDRPHISFFDAANEVVKYVKWTGNSWSFQTIGVSSVQTGSYTSIALDTNGRPYISYYDGVDNELKCVHWTGSQWVTQVVDTGYVIGEYNSIALDAADQPHISYYDFSNQQLKYASWTGNLWETQLVNDQAGRYNSLSLDSDGNPHISYYDGAGLLRYAYWDGSAWHTETVDTSLDGYPISTSLALDVQGRPHIGYIDGQHQTVKYATWNGTSWDVQTVITHRCTPASLGLDSSGKAHFACHDYTNGGGLTYAHNP